jgi:hypothetical protein
MIVNERVVSYIHSLERSNGSLLDELYAYAQENRVPIIRKEVESFFEGAADIKTAAETSGAWDSYRIFGYFHE